LWRYGRNTGILHSVQDDSFPWEFGKRGENVIGFVEFGGFFDFAGSAGRGDVGVGFGDGDPGLFVDVADDFGGAADDAEAASVGGG